MKHMAIVMGVIGFAFLVCFLLMRWRDLRARMRDEREGHPVVGDGACNWTQAKYPASRANGRTS